MKVKINDNKELVNEIRTKLKENNDYCPCSLIKSEDTKCMCKEFRNQELGECHCGLYIKIEE
jgi:ferredoxin-thioredoxin reductase catalytic subunit